MSQTRKRPGTWSDVGFDAISGIHVGQGGRPPMGLIFVILCAIVRVSFGCATEAGRLHDMARRTWNYKNAIGEPLVTDFKIAKGWYSLNHDRLMVEGTGNLTAGSCGTRYQIVIKEGSTIDWDTLDETIVTLTATVYGRPEGHGEDLEIRVRKCGDALQYYLTPPSIRLAAYCFDSLETDPVTDEEDTADQNSIFLRLDGSLNFREELRDGHLYDVPYVSLTCNVNDHLLVENFPEIQFVTIKWFADNSLIKSSGPQPLSNTTYDEYNNLVLAASNLTEDEFLAAGFSIGDVILCGAQLSRSESGKLSGMITMPYDTNLRFGVNVYQVSGNETYVLSVYNPVPIGCLAPVGSVEEICALKLRIFRDDGTLACSESPTVADEHALCGITLVGQTKTGTYDQRRHYTNENGTVIYENDVTFIQIDYSLEDTKRASNYYVSVAVIDNTTGHAMWDNVKVLNAKVDMPRLQDYDYYDYSYGYVYYDLRVYEYEGTHYVNGNGDHPDNGYWSLEVGEFEEPGKYIMLWSKKFPFTFEVETESTMNGSLALCGFYVRYGNDIYAYSICGDVFTEGLIFGDGYYMHIPYTSGVIVKLQEVGLEMYLEIYGKHFGMYFQSIDGFDIDSFEGIGSVGAMVGRHGKIYTNSTGFLRSWRIYDSESLSNPANHIIYSVETQYSTCVCPTKTKDIPEREATYTSDTHINYNVYTGALYCNLDDVCSYRTDGKDWPTTLRPDYLIEEVRSGCEQRIDGAGEPLLWFTCQFKTVQNMLYTVIWYIDKVEFKRIQATTPDKEFGLNDAEIGAGLVFDMKIQCSVTVLDLDSNELISPIMSETFEPIRFPSTNISIQRGGDGTMSWINNIPFLCHGDYAVCYMELQFFDLNDTYDCADSTVAFKADNSCGGRVQATKTVPASTGNATTVIVTTKNNVDYELKTYFELRAMVIFHGAGRSTWTHLLRTVFIVTVVDDLSWTGMDCHLHVDPHARSADGRYYEMQYIGMFVLARHLYLPIQVQVITMPCWENRGSWTSPTCACALVFQAGLDIYLIDRCDGARFSGFLLAEDGVLDVYEKIDNRYQVVFPNTMAVEIRIMPYFNYFMDVDIYPSPNEQQNLVGLCGNFNGDPSDDFQLRDTANQGNGENFSLSWELHETGYVQAESLLEEKNYMNPTRWNSVQTLCVCPNARDAASTPSIPLCSANEENTCTIPKDHKGKKLDHAQRPKRDTGEYVNLDVERRVSRLRRGIAEKHAIHRKRRSILANPYRMNETDARAICEAEFANAPINNLTTKLIQEDQFLIDCIEDVKESGSSVWAKPQIIALKSRNDAAIERNASFTREYPEVVEAMGQICSHACYDHGSCLGNDECQCNPGWGRKSCILDLTIGPEISYISGEGLCDKSTDDCLAFIIETVSGLNESFLARVTELEADNDGKFHIKYEYTIPEVALSFNEAVIDVTSGRRRRSTSSNPALATQYGVSISNDGENYGNVTYVTVLDTRCQETTNNSNGDTIVTLMAGYCYIDGVCYGDGNSSADNSCKICRTETSLFDWTDENCPTTTTTTTPSPSDSHDDGLPLYVIFFSASGGVVLILIIVCGALFLRQMQKKRPVTPLPPPPPYPGTAPVGPMNLRFDVKGFGRKSVDHCERPRWEYGHIEIF